MAKASPRWRLAKKILTWLFFIAVAVLLVVYAQKVDWEEDNLQALIVNDCVRVDESMVPKRTWWNLGISVVVFHFLRHFPAMVGWLPAHTPKLALVDPPVQPEMETQDRVEAEDGGKT